MPVCHEQPRETVVEIEGSPLYITSICYHNPRGHYGLYLECEKLDLDSMLASSSRGYIQLLLFPKSLTRSFDQDAEVPQTLSNYLTLSCRPTSRNIPSTP